MLALFIGTGSIGRKDARRKILSSVVETVTELVTPILDERHFELVDAEFVKEGKSWYLRIYIDKPGGINIEECALVSDLLGEKLDDCDPDPIPQAYFLKFPHLVLSVL